MAIAGLGTVGGLLVERLIRLGIGHLKLTDPGVFEPSNLNRQFGSLASNVGQKKVEAVFAQVKDINPQARIEVSDGGLTTEENIADFARGCDLVIDQMSFGLFRESILLQRAARRNGIHSMFALAIGFGALVVIFDPDGCTLEEYNGLPPDVDIDDPEKLRVPVDRIAPIMPSYALNAATDEMIEMMRSGKMAGPCTSIGAGLAAVLAANEAVNVILHRRDIVVAPGYTYVDLLDRQFTVGKLTQPVVAERPEQAH